MGRLRRFSCSWNSFTPRSRRSWRARCIEYLAVSAAGTSNIALFLLPILFYLRFFQTLLPTESLQRRSHRRRRRTRRLRFLSHSQSFHRRIRPRSHVRQSPLRLRSVVIVRRRRHRRVQFRSAQRRRTSVSIDAIVKA